MGTGFSAVPPWPPGAAKHSWPLQLAGEPSACVVNPRRHRVPSPALPLPFVPLTNCSHLFVAEASRPVPPFHRTATQGWPVLVECSGSGWHQARCGQECGLECHRGGSRRSAGGLIPGRKGMGWLEEGSSAAPHLEGATNYLFWGQNSRSRAIRGTDSRVEGGYCGGCTCSPQGSAREPARAHLEAGNAWTEGKSQPGRAWAPGTCPGCLPVHAMGALPP